LPPDVRVARDAQDLLVECCVGKNTRISSNSMHLPAQMPRTRAHTHTSHG